MSKRWLAVVNPVSGGNKHQQQSERIIRHLTSCGIPLDIKFTYDRGSAIDITKESIETGFRHIAVIGGDGTLNEVVNGLFRQQVIPTNEIKIAMFSLGTGNDFIRTLHIPRPFKKAADVIQHGRPKIIDAGRICYYHNNKLQERYFVNVCGMAFDGAVTEHANKNKGAVGRFTYLKSLLHVLSKYKPTKIRVVIDNQIVANEELFCVNVGNGKYSGGGMRLVPLAIPDDALFDITLIRPLSKIKVVANLFRLFDGSIYQIQEASHFRGRKVVVESSPPIFAEAEGELVGQSPFEIEIVPASVCILIP